MNEITRRDPAFAAAVRLSNIEYSISEHMQSACANLLEVGRCLNQAKDDNLVPHGQWEDWVRRNTGMGERAAQKLMQAARNVQEGSALARLPISKIQAILTLPEDKRENMAEKAVSENMALRELQKAVQDERYRADIATRKADARVDAAIREKEEKAQEVERLKDMLIEANNNCTAARDSLTDVQMKTSAAYVERIEELTRELEAKEKAAVEATTGGGAQDEIDRLKDALADAEAYAEKQAQLRQDAQRALLEKEADEAHGTGSMELESFDLAASVRAFIGSAGVLPHMGSTLAHTDAKKREEMARYVDMVQTWVDGARKALGTVLADISDVQ